MSKKVAIVLSGCGVFDGSEIYESVLTLLALEIAQAQVKVFAPDMEQMHVINHMTGDEMSEKRNVLIEASRIVRGEINELSQLDVNNFDALIVPGGFGVAKNICNFAVAGDAMQVNEPFLSIAKQFHQLGKPIGLICIAPAMTGKIFDKAECTIGNDADTAQAIENMGATHKNCSVDNVVVDQKNKLVTTPAYMLANSISQAKEGIDKLIGEVLGLV